MGHSAGLQLWVDATAGIARWAALIDLALDGVESPALVPGEVSHERARPGRPAL
jgi:hypothetical protein